MLLDRFNQFVEESTELVPAAADELGAGDLDAFGRTVARSQELAERLLRNQVPETVALVRSARDHGAWAASAFGAGFGGSVWALVDASRRTRSSIGGKMRIAPRALPPATRSRFFLTSRDRQWCG